MHFFNPAPVLPLVEVVRTELASDEAVETAYGLAERLGKEPIRCNDTPGFVVNRILIPLLNDCVRVLDEAGVSPEDLDKAMTRGVNWPIGPCALIDLIGVDIHVHASEALHDALGEPRMAAARAARAHARRGAPRAQVGPRLLRATARASSEASLAASASTAAASSGVNVRSVNSASRTSSVSSSICTGIATSERTRSSVAR